MDHNVLSLLTAEAEDEAAIGTTRPPLLSRTDASGAMAMCSQLPGRVDGTDGAARWSQLRDRMHGGTAELLLPFDRSVFAS